MSDSDHRPLPHPDRDSEPFWQALREGELRLQRCSGCGCLRFPPRAVCNRCTGFDAEWVALSGRGTIASWVRTHQIFAPAYRNAVPYWNVQVVVAEQDDIQLIGGWHGSAEPHFGQAVRAHLVAVDSDHTLLDWEPDPESPGRGSGRV